MTLMMSVTVRYLNITHNVHHETGTVFVYIERTTHVSVTLTHVYLIISLRLFDGHYQFWVIYFKLNMWIVVCLLSYLVFTVD